jgi:hypothetical protein
LKIQDNHKTRDVKELLLAHTNIKRVQDNPIVLKWFDDTSSISQSNQCDEENFSKKEKKFNQNELEPMSDTSYLSSCNQEESTKGVQFHPKGEIHEISEAEYRELKGEEDRN